MDNFTLTGRRERYHHLTHVALAALFILIGIASPFYNSTGGNMTYDGGYTVVIFNANGTFNLTGSGSVNATVLVVAGGGGSGGSQTFNGGGGAGGLLYNDSYNITAGQSFNVTVGLGGLKAKNGTNSSFGTMMARGGGRGGIGYYGTATNGSTGGSAGGSGCDVGTAAVAGTPGQGNAGGYGRNAASASGGAGGGAGGAGQNATANSGGATGGAGLNYSINGSNVCYAGGGAGGVEGAYASGNASCGGGAGANNTFVGQNGTDGLGGGAGGGATARGGNGIVIIRYLTSPPDNGNLTVNYTTGGTATGSNSTFVPPANLTINATASSGYYFTNWTTNCNGTFNNSSSANTAILVNDATSCHAQAGFLPYLSLTVSSGIGGTASGSQGNIIPPQALAISASAAPGFVFSNWTGNCTIGNSSNATTTATVTAGSCYALASFNFTANGTGQTLSFGGKAGSRNGNITLLISTTNSAAGLVYNQTFIDAVVNGYWQLQPQIPYITNNSYYAFQINGDDQVWKNGNISFTWKNVGALANITASGGSSGGGSGNITGTGNATYMSYWTNATDIGSTNIFYEPTMGRLGFNTSSPTVPIEINRRNSTNNIGIQVDLPTVYGVRSGGTAYPGVSTAISCLTTPTSVTSMQFLGGIATSVTTSEVTRYNIVQYPLESVAAQGHLSDCDFPAFDETYVARAFQDSDPLNCMYMNFELPWDYKEGGRIAFILNWINPTSHMALVNWRARFRCMNRCQQMATWQVEAPLAPLCTTDYTDTSVASITEAEYVCRDRNNDPMTMAAGDKIQVKLYRDSRDEADWTVYGLVLSMIYQQADIGSRVLVGGAST